MSGQARITVFDGDGGWPQFWLQCHQPLIGAPSPGQANQPWYPTVILPTTSPGGLAAYAVDTPGHGTAAAADRARNVRRVTTVRTSFLTGGVPAACQTQ